jgi:conserved hypothetical integral membrane protein
MMIKKTGACHESFAYLSMFFVAALMTANVLERRPIDLFGIEIPGGTLIFLLTFPVANAITEIFKTKKMRRVILFGAFSNLVYMLYSQMILAAPAPAFFIHQDAFKEVLGHTWIIFGISTVSYVVGDYANAYALVRIKMLTGGRQLWLRCTGSTLIAHIIGGIIFIPVVWWGSANIPTMLKLYAADFAVKIIAAIITYPFERSLILYLKKIGAEEPEEWISIKKNKQPPNLHLVGEAIIAHQQDG